MTGKNDANLTSRVPVWRRFWVWTAVVWERVWRSLWPFSGIAAFFLLLALTDVLPMLPGWLHVALLALLAVSLVWGIWNGIRRFRLPNRFDLDRRLEADSGLSHRPLEAIEDRQAAGVLDPASEALWALHQKRMADEAGKLRARLPHPSLFRLDPAALRFALVLAVCVAAVFAEGDILERLKRSVQPNWHIGGADLAAEADAWITPPEYTRYPPIFLTSDAPDMAQQKSYQAPKGSKLTAQVTGGSGTETVLMVNGKPTPFVKKPGGSQSAEITVSAAGEVAIMQGTHVLGRWQISLIPDDPPTVEFIRDPVKSRRNSLRFHFGAQDDYGVVKVIAAIRRAGFQDFSGAGDAAEKAGPAAEEPEAETSEVLEVELPLPGGNARDVNTTVFRDLTAHRWAGLPVNVRLIATDALGQKGMSKEVRAVLPERRFNHPIAQTIIQERKRYVDRPSYAPRAGVVLDNLAWHYDKFNGDIVAFLGLSVAGRRLMNPNKPMTLDDMEKFLWELALRVEDGRLSLSERAMRQAQDDLFEALNRNAGEAELQDLLEKYERTLTEYFDRLSETLKEMELDKSESIGMGPKAQMMRRQDLMRMLKDIRRYIQNGQRQKARDMLAQLQELMENMRIRRFAKQSEQTRRAVRTVNDLKRLIKSQQELLDRTYRAARDRKQVQVKKQKEIPFQGFIPFPPDNKDWAEKQVPETDQPADKKAPLNEEIDRQERLRAQLGDIMRRIAELNVPIPENMGKAETSMRGSTKNLKAGEAGKSVKDQGKAIDELQKSLKQTMTSLANQASEDPFDLDDDWMQGAQAKEDPFGRPQDAKRQTGPGSAGAPGEDVEIPGIQEGHSAKEIRDVLRRRAGEYERPKIERDYFNRLLKQF